MDARELSEALKARATELAEMLLPAGKKMGGDWRIGSADGEKGQSMIVHLRGPRQGKWKDFATGEGGDMLDLFCRTRGIGVAEAMKEAAAYLGVTLDAPIKPQRTYSRPPRPAATKPQSRVTAWLKARGFTDETITAFKLASSPDDTSVILPYLRDGELVNVKTRSIDDKRKMFQAKDAEPCLFGWHLIDPKRRMVCLTEGEFDAMALHQLGFAALSCNQGAGNHQWIDSDWERLQRFSDIFICYDDDEAGRKGAAEVANRLGIERCRIVTFPKKDANDYLLAGATNADILRSLAESRSLDPDELVSASTFMDEVIRRIYPPDDVVNLDPPLFLGQEQPWFRFRAGEISVWTGINGHGKSQMLGQVMLGLMRRDERVLVFSGEMVPGTLTERATRQAAGMKEPSIPYIRAIERWFAERFWIYKHVGAASTDRLLEVFGYAAKRYGIRHFVIDSLMMLEDVPEEGKGALEAQRTLMIKLAAFAKRYACHVNLVAHPRKSENESSAPGKQDVAGSGKITSMADNVFSVWAKLREENEESDGGPDAKLELLKQRNGESQHRVLWLWFDAGSLQYRSIRDRRSVQYVSMETVQ